MKFTSLVALAALTLCCTSCQSDDDFQSAQRIDSAAITYPAVDEELWPYFDSFIAEANNRGIIVDLTNRSLSGEIAGIATEHVAGTCNYHSNQPNRVTIDKDFWKNAGVNAREAVVFHELGHCILIRNHREAANAGGTCLSLMASGTGNCRLAYGAQNRTAYLDELFDVQFAGDWFE